MDRCPWNPAAMVSTIGHLARLERDVGVPFKAVDRIDAPSPA